MITEITGRPAIGRNTSRLNPSATPIMATHAAPTAPARPSPSAWAPVATIRDASIAHSPRAKLIAPDAL